MIRRWIRLFIQDILSDLDSYKSAEREARLRIEARRQDPDATPSKASRAIERRIRARWHACDTEMGRATLYDAELVSIASRKK